MIFKDIAGPLAAVFALAVGTVLLSAPQKTGAATIITEDEVELQSACVSVAEALRDRAQRETGAAQAEIEADQAEDLCQSGYTNVAVSAMKESLWRVEDEEATRR